MPTPATEVKECVKYNLGSIDGPRDVAEKLDVVYETLRKNYRRQTGRTLGKLIRNTRIRKAKELLRNPDLYCFEVCYEAGFSRDDVAARTFKRHTGMTMSEYRQKEKVPGFGEKPPVEEPAVSTSSMTGARSSSFACP